MYNNQILYKEKQREARFLNNKETIHIQDITQ